MHCSAASDALILVGIRGYTEGSMGEYTEGMWEDLLKGQVEDLGKDIVLDMVQDLEQDLVHDIVDILYGVLKNQVDEVLQESLRSNISFEYRWRMTTIKCCAPSRETLLLPSPFNQWLPMPTL